MLWFSLAIFLLVITLAIIHTYISKQKHQQHHHRHQQQHHHHPQKQKRHTTPDTATTTTTAVRRQFRTLDEIKTTCHQTWKYYIKTHQAPSSQLSDAAQTAMIFVFAAAETRLGGCSHNGRGNKCLIKQDEPIAFAALSAVLLWQGLWSTRQDSTTVEGLRYASWLVRRRQQQHTTLVDSSSDDDDDDVRRRRRRRLTKNNNNKRATHVFHKLTQCLADAHMLADEPLVLRLRNTFMAILCICWLVDPRDDDWNPHLFLYCAHNMAVAVTSSSSSTFQTPRVQKALMALSLYHPSMTDMKPVAWLQT